MNPMTIAPTNNSSGINTALAVRTRTWLALMLVFVYGLGASAEVLDEPALADDKIATRLLALSDELHEAGVDVLFNLNDRARARGRPDRPRLGMLADLQPGDYPDSDELRALEASYLAGELGGIALLSGQSLADDGSTAWLQAADEDRLFISFASADAEIAQSIIAAASSIGWQARGFPPVVNPVAESSESDTQIGRYFAIAAQRLALDSRAARAYEGELPDLLWLGERVRRNSDSIFSDPDNRDEKALARSEPAVFEKESLGDEFSESTIREIVVPGGVALGETAALNVAVSAVRFDGAVTLSGVDGRAWNLPAIELPILKALFDFSERSRDIGSDAIVDIDADSRVKITAALRDTEAGFHLLHADTVPFAYIDYLPVTKSVIIDNHVAWFPDQDTPDKLDFSTEFEVRFLSADNMRLAQTRAALAYDYESDAAHASFERSWGRYAPRLRENLDYAGLGRDVSVIAHYAAWISLWRKLAEDNVRFVEGRYEFMKIDKTGRQTPIRYSP